jgi:hypothetical protein
MARRPRSVIRAIPVRASTTAAAASRTSGARRPRIRSTINDR